MSKSIINKNIFNDCENFNDNDFIKINDYIYNLIKNSKNNFINYIENNNTDVFKIFNENNNLKILYFIDLKSFLFKMSRVRFWGINELSNNKNVNLFYFGKDWPKYNNNISIQQNILNLNINFDIIIWYKPLSDDLKFDSSIKLNALTCLRYNEMWDEEWTKKEILESNTDLVICHHKNDYEKYLDILDNKSIKLCYNPHHANPAIFFKKKKIKKDIDILISGVVKEKHYPLKYKVFKCLKKYENTFFKNYKIHFHNHPGYNHYDSYSNKNQIEYNDLINRSKICIVCSSKHKYRLGKYVEIPMAGGVMCGDIPYEDKENFRKFMIEINIDMTEQQILTILLNTLNNNEILNEKSTIGLNWAKNYTTLKYSNRLLTFFSKIIFKKIFIISDEIKSNHPEFKNEKWICDIIKDEFSQKYPLIVTNNIHDADIIWYLAPWNQRFLPRRVNKNDFLNLLENKFVIATIHHVDKEKYYKKEYDEIFNFTEKYANRYHCICSDTRKFLKKIKITKPIDTIFQWINDKIFFYIDDKYQIRKKYNIPNNSYVIGSFQKDTEGKTNNPKLSKGPDVFLNIAIELNKIHTNFIVILTGLRREYLIENFKKYNIKYLYFNMVSLEQINELYNCLDLYIISSRYEGGPRSVFEAGITKTPLISTKVGISNDLVPNESLFDVDNFISFKNAKPNVDKLFKTIEKYKYDNQANSMVNYFQNCMNFEENINQNENKLNKSMTICN